VRRRSFAALAVTACSIAVATSAYAVAPTASAPAARSALVPEFIPARPGQPLPLRDATAYSGNWSGWVVRPGVAITGVQSVFLVPRATVRPPGFSASWAGIGGYGTHDLIQAGTESDTVPFGGTPKYYAWVETLPQPQRRLLNCTGDRFCTVRPGNRMGVDIHAVGANLWSVRVVNSGHWSWSTTLHYVSRQQSAEWIFEAPRAGGVQTTVPEVGAAYFGRISNWSAAGHRHTIFSGHPVRVVMIIEGIAGREATPSGLAGNLQSFRVCSYARKCHPPAA
jgi:hypothetical protein